MKPKHEKIKKIFTINHGFARTKDVEKKANIRHLYELVDAGKVEKVKRGLYFWKDYEYSSEKELAKVAKIVPNGVLCLLSAASFYDLSTSNPWEYHVAIHRDAHKPALPDYPPIRIFYFSQKQFKTGITEIKSKDIEPVQIYDPEKTVCDCVRYRIKIGKDVVQEVLNAYVRRKGCNIDKLLKYAELTRISKVMREYLEVLL